MRPDNSYQDDASRYQTNAIVDMGQIMPTSGNDANIFSAHVLSNNINDLEAG